MKVSELKVKVETKTKDNVFVVISVAIQYSIIAEKLYEAFYKLADPSQQIMSNVEDVIRSQVPNTTLDHIFESKDSIAGAVGKSLSHVMEQYGYEILRTLVIDIEPDARVKAAMNEINASERLKLAATQQAEAEKIRKITAAEADAKAQELHGVGIANQRRAIFDGLQHSIAGITDGVKGTTPTDAINLVILAQYFDTLKEIGVQKGGATIFVPHSPGAVADLASQIRDGMLQSSHARPNGMAMESHKKGQ